MKVAKNIIGSMRAGERRVRRWGVESRRYWEKVLHGEKRRESRA